MTFERQRRVASLWNWLPAFRAAAEFESIQRASLALHVSPSAISRAVKQLEEAVGFSVFERKTTGVRLTERGRRLLEAVRQGMRSVDDVLEPLADDLLRVGAVSPFCMPLVSRTLPADGWASVAAVSADDAARALTRGELDVVFTHQRALGDVVRCRQVAQLPVCIAHHPSAPPDSPWDLLLGSSPVLELSGALELLLRQRCALKLPTALVPAGVMTRETNERVPIFALTRLGPGAAKVERLTQAVMERLSRE